MKRKSHPPVDEKPDVLLRWFFARNGYVREANPQRREQERARYKKGWEVRLVAYDQPELELIRGALATIGFKVSNSFQKHAQFVQPVYGKMAVEWFREKNAEPNR